MLNSVQKDPKKATAIDFVEQLNEIALSCLECMSAHLSRALFDLTLQAEYEDPYSIVALTYSELTSSMLPQCQQNATRLYRIIVPKMATLF